MKKACRIQLLVLLIVFGYCFIGTGVSPLFGAKNTAYLQLSDKYKKWLDEVTYIMTKNEKEAFLQLISDRERDIFINAFWDHRDPTKGTQVNEKKEEHYKRLRYVEQMYGRNKAIPGWKTDRGKVYIILGPPLFNQKYSSYSTVYPMEIWHYQVEPREGVPPNFNIIFFDKTNTGDFVLYSPLADGPQRLLIGYSGAPDDYITAYQKLAEFDKNLAKLSLSLIPGDDSIEGRPSMASDFLIRNIEAAPKKEVEDLYAKKFLQYKGIVEVEYSVNYIGSRNISQVIREENGHHYFNYMIEYQKLTVDQYDDSFVANIELFGNLTDRAGNTVYQFEKTFNLKLDSQQFNNIRNSSFAIIDQFPVIPGNYKLSVLIKNTNSKEFTSFETDAHIQPYPDRLYLSTPLLAYDIREKGLPTTQMSPFRTPKGQMLVSPENSFSRDETLNIFFQTGNIPPEVRKNGMIQVKIKGERQFVKELNPKFDQFASNENNFLLEIPLNDFPTDYYTVDVSIADQAKGVLATAQNKFYITPLKNVNRAQSFSKFSSLNSEAMTSFILGTQYMNTKKPSEALPLLEKAHNLAPHVPQIAIGLANIYLDLNRLDKIEPLLAPITTPEKPDFQVYFLLGNTCQKLGKYDEAIKYYIKLISYHGLNTDVLNSLATCYYNLGNSGEARRAWEQSLKVDPNQEKVKQALKGLDNEQSEQSTKK